MEKKKSGRRLIKWIPILCYALVWGVSVAVFWCSDPSDAMGYSLVFLWIVLPAAAFAASIFAGMLFQKAKWFFPPAFGLFYMLAEYATFSTANNLTFHRVNPPEFILLFIGTAISLLGVWIGHLIQKKKKAKTA